MDLYEAISERRSHRNFAADKISQKEIEEILEAGLLAPSAKNRQPWHFVSCGPETKSLIISSLQNKSDELNLESSNNSLPISIKAISESSCFLLIYNHYLNKELDYNHNRWKADILSLGACIENIILSAHSKNIQTLWICDILFAEEEIRNITGIRDELVSGIAFGIGQRKYIPKRPRIGLADKLIQTR